MTGGDGLEGVVGRRGGLRWALLALVMGASATSGSARAQAVAPVVQAAAQPSREELNPAARLAPPPARERDIFSAEPPGPCPLRDSTLQFTLRSVSFKGVTALTPAQLAPAYAGLVGTSVPVSSLCDIRDRAARLLFDRGVLARVEIPEQRIADGALVLEVIEAKIVNVRIRGDAGHAQAAVERYMDRLRGMAPFDMRKAQRYLLLASDIPGVQVRAAVRPSVTGERGAVDLDVTVLAQKGDVIANVQNVQAKTVGRWAGLIRGDLNGLTDYGDRTSLVGYHTLDSNEQWVVQLLGEARLGGDGLIARGSLVYGQTRPGDVVAPLRLESDSLVAEVEASYPLLRTRRRNLNLAAGFDSINQTTDTAGVRLYDENLRVFYLRADGDARFETFSRVVQLSGALTMRQGVAGLGASERYSVALSRGAAKPDAWVVRGAGRAVVGLTDRLQFAAQVQAQYSPDPLFGYEQIALGNLTVGRGYDPGAILGDSGASTSLELRYGPVRLHPLVLASPYVFYDVGESYNNGAVALKHRTLASAGVGVGFRIANRANLDVTYATPFDQPIPGRGRPPPRILVNLTLAVF